MHLHSVAFLAVNFLRSLSYIYSFCLPFKSSQTTIVCTYFHSVKDRIPLIKTRKYDLFDRLAKLELQSANFGRFGQINVKAEARCFYILKINECRKISTCSIVPASGYLKACISTLVSIMEELIGNIVCLRSSSLGERLMHIIHIYEYSIPPYRAFRHTWKKQAICIYILYYNLSEELNFVSDIQTEEECRHDKLATIIQHCQMNICVKQ